MRRATPSWVWMASNDVWGNDDELRARRTPVGCGGGSREAANGRRRHSRTSIILGTRTGLRRAGALSSYPSRCALALPSGQLDVGQMSRRHDGEGSCPTVRVRRQPDVLANFTWQVSQPRHGANRRRRRRHHFGRDRCHLRRRTLTSSAPSRPDVRRTADRGPIARLGSADARIRSESRHYRVLPGTQHLGLGSNGDVGFLMLRTETAMVAAAVAVAVLHPASSAC